MKIYKYKGHKEDEAMKNLCWSQKSKRQFEMHQLNPACSGCNRLFPLPAKLKGQEINYLLTLVA